MWLRFSILNEDDDGSNLRFISKQIFQSLSKGEENLQRENSEVNKKTNLHKLSIYRNEIINRFINALEYQKTNMKRKRKKYERS